MATQIYKVADPSGQIREIEGPAGASDAEVIAQAQKLFSQAPPSGMRAVQPGEIPTATGYYPVAEPDVSRSFTQRALGAVAAPLDIALTLGSAASRGLTAPVLGLPALVTGRGEAGAREVLSNIRQPQTPEARAVLEAAAPGLQALPPVIGTGAIPQLAAVPAAQTAGTATRAMAADVRQGAPGLAQNVRAGVQLPLEPVLQARRERLSAESYARGPQLDAAKDAQRLGIALNPTDIQPSVGTRFTTAVAGERGQRAIVETNKNRVRDVVIRDLDLPPTTQFNGPAAYNLARSKLSGPYEQVKQLPIQQADDALIQQLESIRADLNVIGAKDYAPAINKIVDDAIAKTQTGLTGATLLKNISVLRERARKTYNNKAATTEALDIADANLKVATALESMIDNSIFNPKLLSEFRDARQKMARTYAYEGATDFSTGVIDVSKLARITSKDNALTGDIAALGRIAGNFPDAFSTKVATLPTRLSELGRSGAAGTLGGLAGYFIGGDYLGAALGGLAGATAGRLASGTAAQRMVSPGYQAGLRVPDYRTPVVNQLAGEPPIPQNRALVPYTTPQELLMPGEGPYQPNFVFAQPTPQARFVGPEAGPPQLPAPSAEATLATLRAEDARRAAMSRTLGREAEARQAAAEAAARRPAAGEVMLELDPTTGRIREASQGIRGATPETFQNYGASLESAAQKVTAGRSFDLTAAEKVAWERTKVDLADVAPGFKALNDKAIASKMMDRKWVEDTVVKAREKAAAFEQIAARAKDAQARRDAMAKRDQLLDTLDLLEQRLSQPRPVELGGQGPKTRAAKRNALAPNSSNKLAP